MARRSNVLNFGQPLHITKTLQEIFDEYVDVMEQKNLSEHYIKHEHDNMQAVFHHIPSHAFLETVTVDNVVCAFNKMRKNGNKPTTINNRIKTLRRVFNYAIEKHFTNLNPASEVQKEKNDNTYVESMSESQIRKLLSQPDQNTFTGSRNLTMMKLMLDTGIRLREILEVTLGQVDLKEQVIRKVRGKNGDYLDLPITPKMRDQLSTYIRNRGSDLETDALFVTIDGRPMKRRGFQEKIQEYGKRAGITGIRVSPHTLRHTFARLWIVKGGDPFSLQRLLRHRDFRMVQRYVNLWGHEVVEKHNKYSPLVSLDL